MNFCSKSRDFQHSFLFYPVALTKQRRVGYNIFIRKDDTL